MAEHFEQAKTLMVEVVTPDANLFRGEARNVVVTTQLGELAIFPLHAPLVAELARGEMRIKTGDNPDDMRVYSVYGGYMSVSEDHMLVLADMAVELTNADIFNIKRDIDNMYDRLKRLPEDAVDERELLEKDIEWLDLSLTVAKRHQN
ncbi:MAG: ATP synthase F1 subunit epsilon [Coriobacteriia bacterium]|nr:ATP synthase F1 subunit epsilon [Coriobacteriia bacterium]